MDDGRESNYLFVKQIVNKRNLINIPSEESLRLSVTLNNTEYLNCCLMLHYISKLKKYFQTQKL